MCGTLCPTMVQTSARLLALLSLLQVRREWTGRELADRLEVGPRTIRRDIDKLRSLGYPVDAARGFAGGYRRGAGGGGRVRTVGGGDPAAYVRQQISGGRADREADPGRIRMAAPAARTRPRVPSRYATVEPDGEEACIVSTRGAWSRNFLFWMATL